MDMMSNPGFVRDPEKSNDIHSAMALFLKTNSFLTIIYDYSDKINLYPNSTRDLLKVDKPDLKDRISREGWGAMFLSFRNVLIKKQRPDKMWPLQAKHSGQTHFDMETVGKPSRWNTLRDLRVLNHFGLIDKIEK